MTHSLIVGAGTDKKIITIEKIGLETEIKIWHNLHPQGGQEITLSKNETHSFIGALLHVQSLLNREHGRE